MSQADRDRWNKRYTAGSFVEHEQPGSFIAQWLPEQPSGRALDVACGAGRNALFLAGAGYRVDALDVSRAGLARGAKRADRLGLDINWIEHDLDDPYPFETTYNLVLLMWYVSLPLVTRLCECLAPGGYLLCEEHLMTDKAVVGPSNPAFRLPADALRSALESASSEVAVCYYDEAIRQDSEGECVASARLVARKA